MYHALRRKSTQGSLTPAVSAHYSRPGRKTGAALCLSGMLPRPRASAVPGFSGKMVWVGATVDVTSHMHPFALPSDYPRIKVVSSFQELVATPFVAGVNALCWPRTLPGDFREVVEQLGAGVGISTLDDARLNSLPVSAAGRVAIDILLEDQRLLRAQDRDPVLNCIHGYPRDESPVPVRTDVFSFHADSAPVEADTWLCTYHGPPSEGLRNDEAQRRVEIPDTRAALLDVFAGKDDDDFREYLSEHCYDLHYAPLAQARPFSFGLGHLWRIAVDWPGSSVPPCLHRAPETLPEQPPRLLLIS